MNYLLSLVAAACLSLTVSLNVHALSPSRDEKKIDRQAIRKDYIAKRLIVIRQTADRLEKLGREPLSRKVPEKERGEAIRYNRWLVSNSRKLNKFADRWEKTLREKSIHNTTQEMQEMNMSFNLQYLQLQQNMQAENRQFTLISNIMKVKHDTAKNAINNVR